MNKNCKFYFIAWSNPLPPSVSFLVPVFLSKSQIRPSFSWFRDNGQCLDIMHQNVWLDPVFVFNERFSHFCHLKKYKMADMH